MRVLVVTAVAAEAGSVAAGLTAPVPQSRQLPGSYALTRHGDVDVLAAGVGPAAAAAARRTPAGAARRILCAVQELA